MVFNGTVTVINVAVEADEQQNALFITLDIGMPLPFASAPGSTDPVIVPVGKVRFFIDRDTALNWGGDIVELGESLKPVSDLAIATDISAVNEAAKRLEDMKGNGSRDS